MGLGGNVWEWEETEFDLVNDDRLSFRGVRGGNWFFDSFDLAASYRDFGVPSNEGDDVGFRVASIPEPSTMLFGSLAAAGLMLRTKA